MLRLGPQQPGQRRDAEPPGQKRVRRAGDQIVNLTDEGDIRQEQAGTNEMQCLAGLAVFSLGFAQPPTSRVRAQHEKEADGNLQSARNFVPMGGDEQGKAAGDQHGTNRRQN